ncbi:FAD-dependent oxidoreductase [Roseomonas fluvialis]|uniref:Oxygenase n=1 Tax=Roseomonas fluvialis TaxID=1750527 RepID=A0ABM7XYA1_9PROT|nr:FAD-dependent oxidoreductase [Roseomonas fluvialis]BDG70430.1 oxygenase [Roseomonas fluvialis]
MTDTVLIIGSGPVGLTLALELARYGVAVRIVDRIATRSTTSRAVGIWPRTLELLERQGLSDDLVARGNRVTAMNISSARKPIARIDLAAVASRYRFALMLPQSDTEEILERHLDAAGIRTGLGVELTGLDQDDAGVSATLRHADGREETARFAWLVGCDGAHSTIRHALGLSFDGDTMDTSWILADFRLNGAPFPPHEGFTDWHPDGPLLILPLGAGRYRMIASDGPAGSAPRAAPDAAAVQAVLDHRGPGGVALTELIWSSAFRINERQVPRYRDRRVFLAGDAAHIHSPAGAQGMNTGMQDAVNLAWKLTLVSRGLARPALLDSYDAERRPVGAAVIAAAGRMTKATLIDSATGRALRDGLAHLLLGFAPVQHAVVDVAAETSVGYPHSPINGASRHAPRAAGSRVPPVEGEAPYGAGDTPRFVLRADEPPPPGLLERFGALIDPTPRSAAGSGFIEVVRPDGYLVLAAPAGDWTAVAAWFDAFVPAG